MNTQRGIDDQEEDMMLSLMEEEERKDDATRREKSNKKTTRKEKSTPKKKVLVTIPPKKSLSSSKGKKPVGGKSSKRVRRDDFVSSSLSSSQKGSDDEEGMDLERGDDASSDETSPLEVLHRPGTTTKKLHRKEMRPNDEDIDIENYDQNTSQQKRRGRKEGCTEPSLISVEKCVDGAKPMDLDKMFTTPGPVFPSMNPGQRDWTMKQLHMVHEEQIPLKDASVWFQVLKPSPTIKTSNGHSRGRKRRSSREDVSTIENECNGGIKNLTTQHVVKGVKEIYAMVFPIDGKIGFDTNAKSFGEWSNFDPMRAGGDINAPVFKMIWTMWMAIFQQRELGTKAYKPEMLYTMRTVGQFKKWIHSKVGGAIPIEAIDGIHFFDKSIADYLTELGYDDAESTSPSTVDDEGDNTENAGENAVEGDDVEGGVPMVAVPRSRHATPSLAPKYQIVIHPLRKKIANDSTTDGTTKMDEGTMIPSAFIMYVLKIDPHWTPDVGKTATVNAITRFQQELNAKQFPPKRINMHSANGKFLSSLSSNLKRVLHAMQNDDVYLSTYDNTAWHAACNIYVKYAESVLYGRETKSTRRSLMDSDEEYDDENGSSYSSSSSSSSLDEAEIQSRENAMVNDLMNHVLAPYVTSLVSKRHCDKNDGFDNVGSASGSRQKTRRFGGSDDEDDDDEEMVGDGNPALRFPGTNVGRTNATMPSEQPFHVVFKPLHTLAWADAMGYDVTHAKRYVSVTPDHAENGLPSNTYSVEFSSPSFRLARLKKNRSNRVGEDNPFAIRGNDDEEYDEEMRLEKERYEKDAMPRAFDGFYFMDISQFYWEGASKGDGLKHTRFPWIYEANDVIHRREVISELIDPSKINNKKDDESAHRSKRRRLEEDDGSDRSTLSIKPHELNSKLFSEFAANSGKSLTTITLFGKTVLSSDVSSETYDKLIALENTFSFSEKAAKDDIIKTIERYASWKKSIDDHAEPFKTAMKRAYFEWKFKWDDAGKRGSLDKYVSFEEGTNTKPFVKYWKAVEEFEKFSTSELFSTLAKRGDALMTKEANILSGYYAQYLDGRRVDRPLLYIHQRKFDRSHFANFIEKLGYDMRHTHSVLGNFKEMIVILFGAMDVYRHGWDLHFNYIAAGEHGIGKSFLLALLEALLVDGTVTQYMGGSDKSNNVDLSGCDRLLVCEEMPREISGGDSGGKSNGNNGMNGYSDSTLVNQGKAAISTSLRPYQQFEFEELSNGRRVRSVNQVLTLWRSVIFVATNHNTKTIDEAMLDRFYLYNGVSGSKSHDSTTGPNTKRTNAKKGPPKPTILDLDGASTQSVELQNERKRQRVVFSIYQTLHFLIESMIAVGGLPPVDMSLAGMLFKKVIRYLHERHHITVHKRDMDRILLWVRKTIIYDAINAVFFTACPDREVFTPNNIRCVKPYLFSQMHHIVYGVTLMVDQLIDPFIRPVLETVMRNIARFPLHAWLKSIEDHRLKTGKTKDGERIYEEDLEDDDDDDNVSNLLVAIFKEASASGKNIAWRVRRSSDINSTLSGEDHHHQTSAASSNNRQDVGHHSSFIYKDVNYVTVPMKSRDLFVDLIKSKMVEKPSEGNISNIIERLTKTRIVVKKYVIPATAEEYVNTPYEMPCKLNQDVPIVETEYINGKMHFHFCIHALKQEMNGENVLMNAIKYASRYERCLKKNFITGFVENASAGTFKSTTIDHKTTVTDELPKHLKIISPLYQPPEVRTALSFNSCMESSGLRSKKNTTKTSSTTSEKGDDEDDKDESEKKDDEDDEVDFSSNVPVHEIIASIKKKKKVTQRRKKSSTNAEGNVFIIDDDDEEEEEERGDDTATGEKEGNDIGEEIYGLGLSLDALRIENSTTSNDFDAHFLKAHPLVKEELLIDCLFGTSAVSEKPYMYIRKDLDEWAAMRHFIVSGIPFTFELSDRSDCDRNETEMRWIYVDKDGKFENRPLPTEINQRMRNEYAIFKGKYDRAVTTRHYETMREYPDIKGHVPSDERVCRKAKILDGENDPVPIDYAPIYCKESIVNMFL